MEIRVERTEPGLRDAKPHYCSAKGELIGLRITSDRYQGGQLFCPWCGTAVPDREPGHRYDNSVRPETYEGPRCVHGHPDVPCLSLAAADEKAAYELMCGEIREYRAAELAHRYGCGSEVIEWIRPCRRCRAATALKQRPLLRHELEEIAKKLTDDLKHAERIVYRLRDDLGWLHEAFDELDVQAATPPDDRERSGFVYLVGHERAVKIGWSDRHPRGRRLSQLQSASSEKLKVLGLIVGTLSRERQLHRRFARHWIRGEWFSPAEEILAYFKEHGVPV